jgi:M6 family metalloprotease-like protein
MFRPRWEERLEQFKMDLFGASVAEQSGVRAAPPQRHTVGDYVGLCLLIRFPDVPSTISQTQVDEYCNKTGYNGFENNGSVYDYFLDNSNGKLRYTTIVAPYYTAKYPRRYYTNPAAPYTQRTRELINEALTYHVSNGFNFGNLTTDGSGAVFATNVFYVGDRVNNWKQGLWPHASRLAAPFTVAPGVAIADYQITNMGSELELGIYCHENGHMLCDFPDLYNYDNQMRGVGQYCLMCLGGNTDPRNPHSVGAYLKNRAGWSSNLTTISSGGSGASYALSFNQNQFAIYPRSVSEYFIVENRQKLGRDRTLSDAGIAIWHIDELGSNADPNSRPRGHQHFECKLVQADGKDDLSLGTNLGDNTDLFRVGLNSRFDDTTRPSAKWWSQSPSGLRIRNISGLGATMTFDA